MSITYQCAWIHQLRKHLVEREEGIRLCTGGSVGEGTQEGHTEPSGSTWIGKETLAKCLCGDGHEGNKGVPWDGASQGLCWAETNCTSSTRDP